MAFTSESTLQLEEGRQTASQSGSSSSGGGASTGREEISSFRPGPLPQNKEVFSRLFISSFDAQSIDIYAKTAPSSSGGYEFAIEKNGTQQTTLTLGQGSNNTSKDLSFSVGDGDRLEVIGNETKDPDLGDIMAVFDVSST